MAHKRAAPRHTLQEQDLALPLLNPSWEVFCTQKDGLWLGALEALEEASHSPLQHARTAFNIHKAS